MVVLGTPPERLGRFARRTELRIRADNRLWFNDECTTVVLAVGQWLHGIDLVPRGHPGDGRVEIQAYRLRPLGTPGDAPAARVRRAPPAPAHPHADRPPDRDRGLGARAAGGRRGRPGARPPAHGGGPGRRATACSSEENSGSKDPRVPATPAPTIAIPMLYAPETFTEEEAAALRPYFTNLDGPVFALTNLPEVVKGALFARYSRSDKSLRRLFLDEFVGDLDLTGDLTVDATVGLQRAEELYARVFFEYGDDSVAQLGGVHLACEQASNLLTKVLEWGRLMAYLEQSTRYIPYDSRLNGRYRYLRPSEVCESRLGARYVGDMDAIFDTYSAMLPEVLDWARERYPKDPSDSDFVYKQTIKAKACDAVRGVLPAATLSNVGIYGTGQAYEAMLLRMRAHPLPEARTYAQLMLDELLKVIPSFLARVDRPDRGGAWTAYLHDTEAQTGDLVDRLFGAGARDAGRRRHARRLGSRRRGQGARRDLLPAHAPLGGADPRQGAPAPGRRPRRADARVRRRAHQPATQAGPRVRTHRLPLRRAR